MSLWNKIKSTTKQIVGSHGLEITTCVKIAAHTLLPGAGALVETVGALCDYTNEKADDITEDEVLAKLEALGGISKIRHLYFSTVN